MTPIHASTTGSSGNERERVRFFRPPLEHQRRRDFVEAAADKFLARLKGRAEWENWSRERFFAYFLVVLTRKYESKAMWQTISMISILQTCASFQASNHPANSTWEIISGL